MPPPTHPHTHTFPAPRCRSKHALFYPTPHAAPPTATHREDEEEEEEEKPKKGGKEGKGGSSGAGGDLAGALPPGQPQECKQQ